MRIGHHVVACALGRTGISAKKREGDGATPIASLRPVRLLWRGDVHRFAPAPIPGRPIRPSDGWCDAPADRNYNRLVGLPYPASHETMLRDDRLYNLVVVLDWNLWPRRRGAGSAIFLHVAKPGLQPTEGCIALAPKTLRRVLPLLTPRTVIRVMG